jgi:hypothetical protein
LLRYTQQASFRYPIVETSANFTHDKGKQTRSVAAKYFRFLLNTLEHVFHKMSGLAQHCQISEEPTISGCSQLSENVGIGIGAVFNPRKKYFAFFNSSKTAGR